MNDIAYKMVITKSYGKEKAQNLAATLGLSLAKLRRLAEKFGVTNKKHGEKVRIGKNKAAGREENSSSESLLDQRLAELLAKTFSAFGSGNLETEMKKMHHDAKFLRKKEKRGKQEINLYGIKF